MSWYQDDLEEKRHQRSMMSIKLPYELTLTKDGEDLLKLSAGTFSNIETQLSEFIAEQKSTPGYVDGVQLLSCCRATPVVVPRKDGWSALIHCGKLCGKHKHEGSEAKTAEAWNEMVEEDRRLSV